MGLTFWCSLIFVCWMCKVKYGTKNCENDRKYSFIQVRKLFFREIAFTAAYGGLREASGGRLASLVTPTRIFGQINFFAKFFSQTNQPKVTHSVRPKVGFWLSAETETFGKKCRISAQTFGRNSIYKNKLQKNLHLLEEYWKYMWKYQCTVAFCIFQRFLHFSTISKNLLKKILL